MPRRRRLPAHRCRGGSATEETDLRSRRWRREAETAPPAASRYLSSPLFEEIGETGDDVNRQRENDGGVLLDADFREGLQVAQLQRDRFGREHFGRVGQAL